MATPMSRTLCRTVKGRLYTTQTARKVASTAAVNNAEPAKVSSGASCRVATVENYSRLSRVTMVAKAGSRHENSSNLGVSHFLRHGAQMATPENSQFKMIKELQFSGASLSVSTTRDYAYYTVECRRENLLTAMSILSPIFNRKAFLHANWRDCEGFKAKMAIEVAGLSEQPNILAVEMLHQAAFKDTLGNSLYAPQNYLGTYKPEEVLSFMSSHYDKNRLAIVGQGIDHQLALEIANSFTFYDPSHVNPPNDKKARYYGGEMREERPGKAITYAAVATEGPSLASKDLLAASVLQQIMGTGPQVKHSQNIAGSRLVQAVSKATGQPFAITSLNANYTDSGLFGFVCAAAPNDMDMVLRSAFTEFAGVTKTGLKDEEVARGKSMLKSNIMMSMEDGNNQLTNLAEQVLVSETITTPSQVAALVDSITTADVVAVAKKLVNGKPSMSAVGALKNTPYLEELLK